MRIAVLGAIGRVGRLIVEQAVERGHEVVAPVRDPQAYAPPGQGSVEVRQADVTKPESFPGLGDADVAICALGISKGDEPGTLLAGAKVLAGDLQVGGISTARRNIPLEKYPKPFWPPRVSRAAAAALMLDEAEHPTHGATILVPVGNAR